MTRIIVKNGDWDKARAELGASMAAKRKSFDAQFEAAFAPARKPAAAEPSRAEPAPKAAASASSLLLARSSRR
jgi:hypothetical protein